MNIRSILFHNISQITPPAFGLDISDMSLKIAFLKRHKKELILESFGRKELAPGIVKEGKIQKKEELAKAIKQAVKEVNGRKLKTKYVICSLPEQHAFVRVIQLPKMKLAEAKEAVKWEAEANIPMSIEEVYLDWQAIKPIVKSPDHLDVLINAAPKNLVDDYVDVLRGAGLTPMALEIESMTAARNLIKQGVSSKPVLIVDLGFTRTSFIIFFGHVIRFTTSAPVSNQQMINDIAKSLNVKYEEAKKLKFKIGLAKTKKGGKVFNALLPSLNELIQAIQKYIVFYKEHAVTRKYGLTGDISKIILCGGGANLNGLPKFLSLRLKMPVVCGNPWINILKPPVKEIPELSYKESLSYITALGLALRGMAE